MSRKSLLGLALAVTAASIQLSGCGKVPEQTPMPARTMAPADQRVAQDPGNDLRRVHREMLAALNLTEAQRSQIREIKARHKAEMRRMGDLRTQLEQLRTLVLAPTVDRAALTQALTTMHQSKLDKIPHVAAMMSDVRGVLTPEQRTIAVTQLNNRWNDLMAALDSMRTEGFTQLSANLNLTMAQSQALQTLQDQDRTLDDAIMADIRTAVTQFMADGNQQTLTSSLQSALAMSRVTDMLGDTSDFVVSLNQTQRQQLVANMASYLQKLKAMHQAMEGDMGGTDSASD